MRLNCFATGYVGLRHDEFNILVLDSRGINLTVIFIFLRNGRGSSCSRSSHLGRLRNLSSLELLCSLHLSLLTQIFNLGLAKDNVGVRSRVLVHIRLVDDEEDVLRLPDGDTGHSSNLLQPQLGHDLPSLLLTSGLLGLVGSIITNSLDISFTSSFSGSFLQFRDRVIISIRVTSGLVLVGFLLGLGSQGFCHLRHGCWCRGYVYHKERRSLTAKLLVLVGFLL